MSQSDISMQSRFDEVGVMRLSSAAEPRRTETPEYQRMNAEQKMSALKTNMIWPQHSAAALFIVALPGKAPLGKEGLTLTPK